MWAENLAQTHAGSVIATLVCLRPYTLCFVDIPDPSGSYISSSSSSMGFIELQGKEPDGDFQFRLFA